MCEKCNRLEGAIYETAKDLEEYYMSSMSAWYEKDPLDVTIAGAISDALYSILNNMSGRQ